MTNDENLRYTLDNVAIWNRATIADGNKLEKYTNDPLAKDILAETHGLNVPSNNYTILNGGNSSLTYPRWFKFATYVYVKDTTKSNGSSFAIKCNSTQGAGNQQGTCTLRAEVRLNKGVICGLQTSIIDLINIKEGSFGEDTFKFIVTEGTYKQYDETESDCYYIDIYYKMSSKNCWFTFTLDFISDPSIITKDPRTTTKTEDILFYQKVTATADNSCTEGNLPESVFENTWFSEVSKSYYKFATDNDSTIADESEDVSLAKDCSTEHAGLAYNVSSAYYGSIALHKSYATNGSVALIESSASSGGLAFKNSKVEGSGIALLDSYASNGSVALSNGHAESDSFAWNSGYAYTGSVAMGNNTSADNGSMAFGNDSDYLTYATNGSLAWGFAQSYNGSIAMSFGEDNKFTSATNGSLAIGKGSSADNGSCAIGFRNYSLNGSYSLGNETSAINGSVAFGSLSNELVGCLIGYAENGSFAYNGYAINDSLAMLGGTAVGCADGGESSPYGHIKAIAIGTNTSAFGSNGEDGYAHGDRGLTVAIGYNVVTSGHNNFVYGYNSNIGGAENLSFGADCTAYKKYDSNRLLNRNILLYKSHIYSTTSGYDQSVTDNILFHSSSITFNSSRTGSCDRNIIGYGSTLKSGVNNFLLNNATLDFENARANFNIIFNNSYYGGDDTYESGSMQYNIIGNSSKILGGYTDNNIALNTAYISAPSHLCAGCVAIGSQIISTDKECHGNFAFNEKDSKSSASWVQGERGEIEDCYRSVNFFDNWIRKSIECYSMGNKNELLGSQHSFALGSGNKIYRNDIGFAFGDENTIGTLNIVQFDYTTYTSTDEFNADFMNHTGIFKFENIWSESIKSPLKLNTDYAYKYDGSSWISEEAKVYGKVVFPATTLLKENWAGYYCITKAEYEGLSDEEKKSYYVQSVPVTYGSSTIYTGYAWKWVIIDKHNFITADTNVSLGSSADELYFKPKIDTTKTVVELTFDEFNALETFDKNTYYYITSGSGITTNENIFSYISVSSGNYYQRGDFGTVIYGIYNQASKYGFCDLHHYKNFVFGSKNTLKSTCNYVFGEDNTAITEDTGRLHGCNSITMGQQNFTSANTSVNMGACNYAVGDTTVAMGEGLSARDYQVVLGKENIPLDAPTIQYNNEEDYLANGDKAILIVGNGYYTSASNNVNSLDNPYAVRSNAMVVYQNGEVSATSFRDQYGEVGQTKTLTYSLELGNNENHLVGNFIDLSTFDFGSATSTLGDLDANTCYEDGLTRPTDDNTAMIEFDMVHNYEITITAKISNSNYDTDIDYHDFEINFNSLMNGCGQYANLLKIEDTLAGNKHFATYTASRVVSAKLLNEIGESFTKYGLRIPQLQYYVDEESGYGWYKLDGIDVQIHLLITIKRF